MVNFWKLSYETVKEQRDKYKAENDILIDELTWYKAKVNRLERDNSQFIHDNNQLLHENEGLRSQIENGGRVRWE